MPATSATLSSSSTATGAASVRCSRGVTISSELQNSRMPILDNAMMPTRLDPRTAPHSIHIETGALPGEAPPSSAAERISSLPMKPDSGGSPVISSAHPRKLMPRKAIAAGMTIPTASSEKSGSGESSGLNRSACATASFSRIAGYVRSSRSA